MDKLLIFFVIALFSNAAYGQDGQTNDNEEDLDNRFNRPFWFPGQNVFPGQFPGMNQFPGQNLFPGQNQFPGQNLFPGQNQLPGQNLFPGQNLRPVRVPGTTTTTTTTTAAPANAATTTMSPALRSCISTCPVTPEYNPVCGTDRVTYNNPGRLACAQMCGVNVSLQRTSPCPPAQPAAAATK